MRPVFLGADDHLVIALALSTMREPTLVYQDFNENNLHKK